MAPRCDCSGLSKFFETDYGPTHQMQQWRAELSMYACKWEHQPGDLLTDCNILIRYNLQTEAWRKTEAERQHEIDSRSKHLNKRSLQLRVVPESLQRTVFAACHVPPFAGHSGRNRTMYQLQSRFWWPSMTRNVATGVSACGHCMLGNNTLHEYHAILQNQASNEPFDTRHLVSRRWSYE
jgi:hypothetical protein